MRDKKRVLLRRRLRSGEIFGKVGKFPSIGGGTVYSYRIYDTNWWKSFVHARLAVALGDRGCLSIFGNNFEPHRLLSEQLTAEYYVKTEGRGRTVDEWKSRPDQPDNHWFDCLVGASMAASMQGCVLFGTDGGRYVKRNDRVSFKELQKRRKG
jgi:hypothetical protein